MRERERWLCLFGCGDCAAWREAWRKCVCDGLYCTIDRGWNEKLLAGDGGCGRYDGLLLDDG